MIKQQDYIPKPIHKIIPLILLIYTMIIKEVSCWCLRTTFAGIQSIQSVDFSPDGEYILTGQISGRVMLWKTDTLEILKTYHFGHRLWQAVFSKNQAYIAIVGQDDDIHIISPGNFTLLFTIPSGQTKIYDVDYRYDSRFLITCGADQKTKMWNATDGSFFKQVTNTNEGYTCEYGDNNWFATAGHRFVQTWDNNTNVNNGGGGGAGSSTAIDNYFLDTHPLYDFYCIRIKPNTDYFIAVDVSRGIMQGVVDSNNTKSMISGSSGNLYSCAYSRDSTYFAVAGDDSNIYMFNATSRANTIESVLKTQSASIFKSAQFSYDSNNFLAGNQNGTVYFYQRFCNGCPVGSYPNKTTCRKCSQAMVGCSICTNSSVCKSCMSGYYISSNVCKTCHIIEGCANCNSSSNCTSCLTGYYMSGNSCVNCLMTQYGCQQCENGTSCLECDKNSYLVNGTCIKCTTIDLCIYCNSSTFCLECRPGYWQNNGTCAPCTSAVNPFCLICQTETTCTSCVNGYRVNSSLLCEKCVPECLFCNNTGHCFDCIERMYVSAAFVCTFCVHPCVSCNSSTYCHSCVSGFYLSAAGVCTNCPGGCLSCNTSSRCQACDSGFYLNTATHTCQKCALITPYCRQCSRTDCLACELEYQLDSGTCSECSSLIDNCQVCDNLTMCQQCMTGYYATGLTGSSSCHICDQVGCSSCKSSTQCYACQPGYYITGQDCALCANKCLTCTSGLATACTSCIEGYYLSSTTVGTCLTCGGGISKCAVCLNSTYCVGCNIGYYLSSPTTCTACTRPCTTCKTSVTDCMTCDLGFYFYLVGPLGRCAACNAECSQCSTSASTCLNCVQGYYHNSSSLQCINCSQTLPGCTICQTNTTCILCTSGYFPVGTACAHCQTNISKCLRCNTLGSICTLCDYGFALSATNTSCQSCQTSITHCQHCTSSSYCQTCKAMFYANGGACSSCPVGCLTCYNNTMCEVCADTYVMLTSKLCQLCQDAMQGCQLCTSNMTCTNCIVGYYLNSSICYKCRSAMEGCQYCSDSSHCVQCSLFYQLSVNATCVLCSSLYLGCQICNNSTVGCTECSISYFLDSSGICQTCSNITSEGCLKCSSNSTCTQCMAGYYLSNTSLCIRCDTTYPNCIYCNFTTACSQCQSGYYLNNASCSACPRQGCQICFVNNPTRCVGCNSRYYLSGDQCLLCSSSMPQCQECQTAGLCIDCSTGFYLTSTYQCALCSDMIHGCQICSPTGCIDCMANFFLNTTDLVCRNCTDYIPGCAFCLSQSVCISCQNGYYSINSTCEHCAAIIGCLYCINQTHCSFCEQSYYLNHTDSTCYSCKDVILGCYSCASQVMCIGCYGNYRLVAGTCQQIRGEVVKQYAEIGIKSYYMNDTCLMHTLFARQFTFTEIDQDWQNVAQLALMSKNYTRYPLTILKVQWAENLKQIYFYTNNPIANELSESVKNMPFVKNKAQRLLQDTSTDLGFNLKLKLTESATHDIMPQLSHLGDLYLDYPYSDSEFYQSFMRNRKYYYYVFGMIVTVILLIGYSIKLCCVMPLSKDRGSIIPHVFAIKCGALALYPTYGEYVSFCYGFMTAQFPWFNSNFGEKFGNQNDFSPEPYKMYYTNLSIISTYFMALLVIVFIWCLINLLSYLNQTLTPKIQTYKSLMYNFFGLGAIMSGCLSLQGVILNPIDSPTANTFFYIVGIVIYFGIFVQLAYSWSMSNRIAVVKKQDDDDEIGLAGHFRKLRLFIKATLLSLMHMGPLYYISALFCVDIGAILIQKYYIKQQKVNPKLEFIQHILADLCLLLTILIPDALLGIVIGIILISTIIILEFIRFFLQAFNSKNLQQYAIERMQNIRVKEEIEAPSLTNLNQMQEQQAKKQTEKYGKLMGTKSNKITQSVSPSSSTPIQKKNKYKRPKQQISEFAIHQLNYK